MHGISFLLAVHLLSGRVRVEAFADTFAFDELAWTTKNC